MTNEEIRADERKKFAEWLNENRYLHYVEYDDDEDFDGNITYKTIVDTLDVDMLIEQYEKEQKNGRFST